METIKLRPSKHITIINGIVAIEEFKICFYSNFNPSSKPHPMANFNLIHKFISAN